MTEPTRHRIAAALALGPAGFAAAWLIGSLVHFELDDLWYGWRLIAAYGAVATGALVTLLLGVPSPALARKLVVQLPAIVAPIGLFSPWVSFGWSYGGFEFFVVWLTKYPNFGPINYEVLGGMFCVIVASCGPAVGAAWWILRGRPNRVVFGLFALGVVVGYTLVLIHLDLGNLQWVSTVPEHALGGVTRAIAVAWLIGTTVLVTVNRTHPVRPA